MKAGMIVNVDFFVNKVVTKSLLCKMTPKSFLEQIKERLGIRAKGRRIYESEDEYQVRERQAFYWGRHESDTENTFDWNLSNQKATPFIS
jgi:hypothetical protein